MICLVVGNMSGLIVAAFLSHFLGFVGPFAAVGLLSIFLPLFLDRLVDFVDSKPIEKSIELSVQVVLMKDEQEYREKVRDGAV